MKLLYLVFVALLLIPLAAAEPIDITVKPQNQTVDFKHEAFFVVEVQNNQNKTDTISFAASGPYLYWVSFYNKTLTLKSGEKGNVAFILYPTSDVGSFIYNITASSKSAQSSAKIFLNVVPSEGVILKDYVFWHWPEKVSANLFVKTLDKKIITAFMEILRGGNVVEKTSVSKEVYGEESIFEFIELDTLELGDYQIKVSIEGTSIQRLENIVIEPNITVKINKTIKSSPFFDEVRIRVENLGNAPQINYMVFEEIPKGSPLNFITKISDFEDFENKIKYEFTIERLNPGDSVEIVYRIEYWQIILITSAIIIIAGGIMIWYINRLRNPKIRKKYIRKKGGFTVVLEMRGSLFYDLKNVTVKDWVSSLAKVQQNFETIKPLIRASPAGTELIWKIGDLKRGEDRIIHYNLVPTKMGRIKLDKAWMRFSKKDKQYKKYSNVIVVEEL